MLGVRWTPELLLKLAALVFALGVLWEKVDSVEYRVARIEAYMDRRADGANVARVK